MDGINVHDFKTNYSRYLDQVVETQVELLLSKHGKPVAKLVPLSGRPRRPGSLKGKLWIAEDFDEALTVAWDAVEERPL